jgi:hypothetical protein
MKLDLLALLNRDDAKQSVEKQIEETAKIGVLRGGNSGCGLGDGNFTGECPRKAFMRFHGLFQKTDPDRFVMFEAGLAVEDTLIKKIERNLQPGQRILRQDECGTAWVTSNGTHVTGSPDIVIADSAGNYLVGIEVKQVSSLWTGLHHVQDKMPSLKHLCQAGHYMDRLKLPAYKLINVNPVDFQLPGFKALMEKLPKVGTPGSEYFQYDKRGSPKKLLPFRFVYDLEFGEDGYLKFRQEGSKGFWTTTIVHRQGITDFYEHVSNMDKDLGPRPLTLKCTGDFENYNLCTDYCDFVSICDAYESHPDRWLKAMAGHEKIIDLKK